MYETLKKIVNKNHLSQYLFISFLLSLTWVFFARDEYGYNYSFYEYRNINIFPLTAWTLGLFSFYLLFLYINNNLKIKMAIKEFIFFVFVYWLLLLLVETVGYHLLNINNVATSAYSGLPLCNCMHAPRWMQYSYFMLGPIYFVICALFDNKKKIINKLKKASSLN